MKRTDPMSIRQIIDHVMDTSTTRGEFLEHKASALWPDIVGQGINRHTIRRYVSKGVLHVYMDSGPVKNEIEFHKEKIMLAINDAVGSGVLTSIVIH